MIDAYLCMGSNAPEARLCLDNALCQLAALAGWQLCDASAIYMTEPQNYHEQPWFHNQVIRMGTSGVPDPAALMANVLAIEQALGRKRDGPRFGPRSIDIDILLLGEIVSNDPFCTLPHPRLTARAFALVPLLEIAPEIRILGRAGREWLADLHWRQEGNKIFQ